MESKSRCFVKALLWQVLGLFSMTGVGMLFTESIKVGGSMALVNAALGFLVYIVYERFWDKITWGRRAVRINGENIHQY